MDIRRYMYKYVFLSRIKECINMYAVACVYPCLLVQADPYNK